MRQDSALSPIWSPCCAPAQRAPLPRGAAHLHHVGLVLHDPVAPADARVQDAVLHIPAAQAQKHCSGAQHAGANRAWALWHAQKVGFTGASQGVQRPAERARERRARQRAHTHGAARRAPPDLLRPEQHELQLLVVHAREVAALADVHLEACAGGAGGQSRPAAALAARTSGNTTARPLPTRPGPHWLPAPVAGGAACLLGTGQGLGRQHNTGCGNVAHPLCGTARAWSSAGCPLESRSAGRLPRRGAPPPP